VDTFGGTSVGRDSMDLGYHRWIPMARISNERDIPSDS
jgi:hypothetical protein